jgi:hypothetical protein
VGCYELCEAGTGGFGTDAGKDTAGGRNDAEPGSEIRKIPIHWQTRPDLADKEKWTITLGRAYRAGTVQAVPLRLKLPLTIENLDTVIFPIGDVDPAVGVAVQIVRNIEFAGGNPRPPPGCQQFAGRRKFMDACITVAIGNIDVTARGKGGVGSG